MSVLTNVPNLISSAEKSERRHWMLVGLATAACVLLLVGIAAYGFDYYWLDAADRAYSPKHPILRPGGLVGVKLGILGVVLFLLIFLYPLRKRIPWMARRGTAKHWLDFHVVLGMTAPVLIAFHASFKFHGIAGMAFWIMLLVALSGFVGRYLYAQIPRSINAAELSLRELAAQEEELTNILAHQDILSASILEPLLRGPSPEEVKKMPALRAVFKMMTIDFLLPFRIARLRRCVLSPIGKIVSLGGLLATSNAGLERVVRAARHKASLSKRIAFLARTQEVLHLWHVIHRPFSYSFAVLAVLHITVAMGLGFM
jgi:hypothetical protein